MGGVGTVAGRVCSVGGCLLVAGFVAGATALAGCAGAVGSATGDCKAGGGAGAECCCANRPSPGAHSSPQTAQVNTGSVGVYRSGGPAYGSAAKRGAARAGERWCTLRGIFCKREPQMGSVWTQFAGAATRQSVDAAYSRRLLFVGHRKKWCLPVRRADRRIVSWGRLMLILQQVPQRLRPIRTIRA